MVHFNFVPYENFFLVPFVMTVLDIFPQPHIFDKKLHLDIIILPIMSQFISFM